MYIKLIPDHLCTGLWSEAGESLILQDLGLSKELEDLIKKWAAEFDMSSSEQDNSSTYEAWVVDFSKRGYWIAKRIKCEKPSWKVVYRWEASGIREEV